MPDAWAVEVDNVRYPQKNKPAARKILEECLRHGVPVSVYHNERKVMYFSTTVAGKFYAAVTGPDGRIVYADRKGT